MKFFYHLLMASTIFAGCTGKTNNVTGQGKWGNQPAMPVVDGQESFTIPGSKYYVNVMGNAIPRMPNFPAVSVKKNYARGYVADLTGKPLKGAHVGVASSLTGGWYSSGSGVTDENGYYEFLIPAGAAYFFGTATTITYNGTPAVVALYPVGGTTRFASGEGVVRNFALLSYGPANPEEVAAQPNNETNYYGGALYFWFNVNYPGDHYDGYLPSTGVIEIELIPVAPCMYGEIRSFRITRQIGDHDSFKVVNIPVGKYTIKAKMSDGRLLKMKATGTVANVYENLGLGADNTPGISTVTFTPEWQATPVMVSSFKSNWDALEIQFSL